MTLNQEVVVRHENLIIPLLYIIDLDRSLTRVSASNERAIAAVAKMDIDVKAILQKKQVLIKKTTCLILFHILKKF
jgi:hypothetical protein